MLRAIYDSGVVGNYMRGTYTVKPDNTVEKVTCLRKKHASGKCSYYEQPNTMGMFASIDKTSFFALPQTTIKKLLLDDAESGTVYIQYWYGGQKCIAYYVIPDEDVVYPIYETTHAGNQPDFIENAKCVSSVHVVHVDDDAIDQDNADETSVDVTESVMPFVGPKHDFHRSVDDANFRYIFDYIFQTNKCVRFSDIIVGGFKRSIVRVTYADLHTDDVCLF